MLTVNGGQILGILVLHMFKLVYFVILLPMNGGTLARLFKTNITVTHTHTHTYIFAFRVNFYLT